MINDVDHKQPQPEKHFWTEDMSKEFESFRMSHFDTVGELGDVGIESTAKPKASEHQYDIICFQCRKYYNDTCPVNGKGNAISCSYYDKI